MSSSSQKACKTRISCGWCYGRPVQVSFEPKRLSAFPKTVDATVRELQVKRVLWNNCHREQYSEKSGTRSISCRSSRDQGFPGPGADPESNLSNPSLARHCKAPEIRLSCDRESPVARAC